MNKTLTIQLVPHRQDQGRRRNQHHDQRRQRRTRRHYRSPRTHKLWPPQLGYDFQIDPQNPLARRSRCLLLWSQGSRINAPRQVQHVLSARLQFRLGQGELLDQMFKRDKPRKHIVSELSFSDYITIYLYIILPNTRPRRVNFCHISFLLFYWVVFIIGNH
jgi:hypothetical protein